MGTAKKTLPGKTVDVRELILRELERRKMSRYALVKAAKAYGIGEVSVYDFLAARSPINSDYLGHLLALLDLEVTSNQRPRKS